MDRIGSEMGKIATQFRSEPGRRKRLGDSH
jgi:hypothetical protein